MFDGIKLEINDPETTAYLSKYLNFIAAHKESREVINTRFKYKYARFKGLHFKQFESGFLEVNGSLHCYFNNCVNNYTQFTLKDVGEAIKRLADEFKINPFTAIVHNLEFGVNLETPNNPAYFLDSIVAHKTNLFNKMVAPFYGKTSKYDIAQYWIKCYNKGQQFHLNNILRYELRFIKMEKIDKKLYLADLLTPAIIDRCKKLLIDSFNELIISEPVSGLSNKDHQFYLQYINPNYHKTTLNKFKRHRDKEKYNQLLVRYSTDRIKKNTLKLLIKTLQNLTSAIPEKRNLLTDIVKPIFRVSKKRENSILQPFDHLDKLSKGCIALLSDKQPIKCISCGRDISNQKAGSLYCSEKLFGSGAKKCRNKNSNPRNNFKKKIQTIKSNGILFEIEPFIKMPPFNNC